MPRLPAGQCAKVELSFPPSAPDVFGRELYHAIWLLSALGGIGGRSRRGWGSLRLCCDFPDGLEDPHANAAEGEQVLEDALVIVIPNKLPDDPPPFTAFSRQAKVLLGPKGESWSSALDALGRQFADTGSARSLERGVRGKGRTTAGAEHGSSGLRRTTAIRRRLKSCLARTRARRRRRAWRPFPPGPYLVCHTTRTSSNMRLPIRGGRTRGRRWVRGATPFAGRDGT